MFHRNMNIYIYIHIYIQLRNIHLDAVFIGEEGPHGCNGQVGMVCVWVWDGGVDG